ncbi:hypothetical protein [Paenibacillus sp. ALJ109b]|uniref:hypothetical protein n=1 Tax=Paenibacillus sp. ALJ109b TaxID=2709068 RepID=UPI0013D07C13|nr:hypothetical protein [Paenibacillus sp. ALJ109b]NEU64812.1 hypothetical protein [Paenibacillus sp. ALJ109b]
MNSSLIGPGTGLIAIAAGVMMIATSKKEKRIENSFIYKHGFKPGYEDKARRTSIRANRVAGFGLILIGLAAIGII